MEIKKLINIAKGRKRRAYGEEKANFILMQFLSLFHLNFLSYYGLSSNGGSSMHIDRNRPTYTNGTAPRPAVSRVERPHLKTTQNRTWTTFKKKQKLPVRNIME